MPKHAKITLKISFEAAFGGLDTEDAKAKSKDKS
jgi:hypothetical protein